MFISIKSSIGTYAAFGACACGIFLAFLIPTISAQTSCLAYPSGSTPPSGYAASWDVFSSARELLVKVNCPSSGSTLTLSVGKGDTAQLIHDTAWSYTGAWNRHTLSGTAVGTGWLSGSGTATLGAPSSASAANPFFFVGYVCTNRSGTWKCGCENTACSVGKWQLQGYTGRGGGGGGSASECPQVPNGLFQNPFNLRSAHHRPIGAGATIGVPRGYSRPDFVAGRTGATYLQNPVMSMEDALSRIGEFRLGTTEQGRKGLFCVSADDTNASGSGSLQVFREYTVSDDSFGRWTSNTMTLRVPRGDIVRGGNDGVYYPENEKGGDYTYAFAPRGGSGVVVDMFTDFVGPISSSVAAADPAGLARAGEMGFSAHGSYRLDQSDTQETPGYYKSAARLRWPGTVLRGFEINPENPAPIRHSLNVAATRHNGQGADNGAHIMGKQIVWPAAGVDGSLAQNYDRTDQNQGGFPYGTNLRVPVDKHDEVAGKLAGNPRGLAILHAITYYGVYLVDGHGAYVTVGGDKKGVMQMRIDHEVGRRPDGSDIPGVIDDVNRALDIILPYLRPVGNPPLWSDLNSQFTGGLPYLGGGGPINSNSINTAFDAPR